MPFLDVSDLLDDPDFADDTLVYRRVTEVPKGHGRVDRETVLTPFSGVVTQDSGRDLTRNADGSMISGTITIHTGFLLKEADEVVWQGVAHTVTNVMDWSTFGAGFVCATAMRKPLGG